MKLHELEYTKGARHTTKRLGRGQGSGLGKTSGKGHKGQNARSGGGVAIGFEGGQTPLYKRIPKRGFTNFTKKNYAIINVEQLNKFEDGVVVDEATLQAAKVVSKIGDGVKVLGMGSLEKKLTVKVTKVSKSAKAIIEKAGGSVEVQ